MTFKLKIFTPDELLFEAESTQLIAQAVDGLVTILPEHMPFVTHLDVGIVTVFIPQEKKPLRFAVNGGTMSFRDGELRLSTIEALEIGRKEKDSLFAMALEAKNSAVESEIEAALKAGGYYVSDTTTTYLLAEERLAKYELLKTFLDE